MFFCIWDTRLFMLFKLINSIKHYAIYVYITWSMFIDCFCKCFEMFCCDECYFNFNFFLCETYISTTTFFFVCVLQSFIHTIKILDYCFIPCVRTIQRQLCQSAIKHFTSHIHTYAYVDDDNNHISIFIVFSSKVLNFFV